MGCNRLCTKEFGYAEIGWTPKENRNWEEYKMRLEMQEERLGYEGVNYYKES